jgi:hypothetical protein
MKKCLFTLCNDKYAPDAEMMIESFLKYNLEYNVVVFLLGQYKFKNPTIEVRDFSKNGWGIAGYTLFEAIESSRPFAQKELLQEYDEIVYSDSDMLFYDKIPEFSAPMSYTKHLNDDSLILDKTRYIEGGFINIGFYNMKKDKDTISFLDFLCSVSKKRMPMVNHNGCGRYWMQRIFNYLPFLGFKYEYINHLGINVAYWNIETNERRITEKDGKYFVNENIPLISFHFSGDTDDERLSKHSKITMKNNEVITKIFKKYREARKKCK